MHVNLHDLQIVVLDDVSRNLAVTAVRDLFASTMELKLSRFREVHGERVLPVDASDFVGTHFLVCKRRATALIPWLGFRLITHTRCRDYGLEFPALSLARRNGSREHVQMVERVVADASQTGGTLVYVGAVAMSAEARRTPGDLSLMRSLFAYLYVAAHRDLAANDSLVGATLRVKMDRTLARLGQERLRLPSGHPLSPFGAVHLGGEPVLLMRGLPRPPPDTTHDALWSTLWSNRISEVR